MTEAEIQDIVNKAIQARERAYTPYSNFKVGAALIDNNGNTHIGANIENGSYGLTNCAERTAIFTAKTQGMESISVIAIVADTTGPVSPCGACRQVISEFANDDSVIILGNLKGDYKILDIDELLPYRFKL
ncbi:cytidine deaminase [Thiospirochaeta perfilievii]|uniref:Cytidine deaminase n=1 Tax=Thiospirochaeta perfilievii TaxID=252967 RepID=A0A5C1QDI3_9SPIO|nr:cytidine deaminase [Thiospirochaeta perfilievii]QEN06145.1 cytidine deaminase [Thiospirochaeta perfilievii]